MKLKIILAIVAFILALWIFRRVIGVIFFLLIVGGLGYLGYRYLTSNTDNNKKK